MERIGVDPAGARIMAPKQLHYNLKVEGLTPAQANILKQDILSIGGEAAVAMAHFLALFEKLARQAFGLPEIAASMKEAIKGMDQRTYVVKGGAESFTIGPSTLIMGILNVTPDSFSDGGAFVDRGKAAARGLEMAEEGARWIDVGGESTRPGAKPICAEDELKRVLPVVEALSKAGLTVSIDTTKAAVAKAALEAGASIINDVSALTADDAMADVAAASGAPVILMHRRGTPETMQLDTRYADLMGEVYGWLHGRVEFAVSRGIDRDSIIVDPGLGFGKSMEGNLEILGRLKEFKSLGRPVLVGASRKSFIGRITGGADAGQRLSGTLAASVAAVMNGASILRVHDVKEAKDAALVADAIVNHR